MIYLYWYLGIGEVILISMMVSARLSKKNNDSFDDILDKFHPERRKLWYNFSIYLLGLALFVPFWPVILLLRIRELATPKPADVSPEEEPEFAVTHDDLQASLGIQEIEQREMVIDPLNAVPNVPFGHLNAAWEHFREEIGPHDSLWSFSANWTSRWGCKDFRQGYVIVCGEEIKNYFLTTLKRIEDDEDDKTTAKTKKENVGFPGWLRKYAD
jgi:hypothetical protein